MNRPVILTPPANAGSDTPPDSARQARRSPRRSLIKRAVVTVEGKTYPCRLRNLYDTGAQLVCDAPLHAGQVVGLEVEGAGYRFATVQWRDGQRAGVSFGELPESARP